MMSVRRSLYLFGVLLAYALFTEVRLYALHDEVTQLTSRVEELESRAYHLTYIQDSHTSDIYRSKMRIEETERALRHLRTEEADILWRIQRLEWNE